MTVQLLIDKFLGTALTEGPERTDVSDKEEKEEESVYEKEDITHGHCGCCTSIEASEKFAEERAAAIRRLHAGRNERARQRQRKASTLVPKEPFGRISEDWEGFDE